MANETIASHLERLRMAIRKKNSAEDIAKWICENTYLGGQKFSFHEREFQEQIANDKSQEVNVIKASQVGLSELSARIALAYVNCVTPFTCIYTLPTSTFASVFARTRIDPVIAGSKALSESIHKTLDNNEVKNFNGESYLYLRGASSNNAPISIPADMLIHDEYSFCDLSVLTQYQSRLTASKHRLIRRFSTPQLPGQSIDKEFQQSRRHYYLTKCDHCNHSFNPDYTKHVKIPGFKDDILSVTKDMLAKIRWQEAKLLCPKCGKEPDLGPKRRQWVCENPSDNYVASGYMVSPFDAPSIITPAYLVNVSTNYQRQADFFNYGLGKTFEDQEATLMRSDFDELFVRKEAGPGSYVMGADVGAIWHIMVARVDGYGALFIVHSEQVPMGSAKRRYEELRLKYNVICTVADAYPHSESIMALQDIDDNMYAGVFTKLKDLTTHKVINRGEDREEGVQFKRSVNINRDRALDAVLNIVRGKQVVFRDSDLKETIISHHLDMFRARQFDTSTGELSYHWQKSAQGQDHFMFALLYAYIASRIMGVSRTTIQLPTAGVFSFRLKQK